MNAHQLYAHYENAPRIIHHEKPPPEFAYKTPCFAGLALFQRDMEEITRITKPPATIETRKYAIAKVFRQRVKSRLPEIRKLLAEGDSVWEVAQKTGLSETTIRRVIRHLSGELSDEKNAIAVIGTHKITGEVIEFASMNQAEIYGIFQGSKIGLCLIGGATQHKGYIWKRAVVEAEILTNRSLLRNE